MKQLPNFLYICILIFSVSCSSSSPENNQQAEMIPSANSTSSVVDEGWEVLFDGNNMDKWRGFQKGDNEKVNWQVEDGLLTTTGGNGDIITKETFRNFDLEFDWKISKKGNSGIIYNIKENDYKRTINTGPEFQLIDDEEYPQNLEETQKSGANYALNAPTSFPSKPAGGDFNTGRIIVNEGHVEHYINGVKVVEYDLWTPEWEEQVKKTKFADMPGYGRFKEGHIGLQDHGDQVWFRNIRIKRLK